MPTTSRTGTLMFPVHIGLLGIRYTTTVLLIQITVWESDSHGGKCSNGSTIPEPVLVPGNRPKSINCPSSETSKVEKGMYNLYPVAHYEASSAIKHSTPEDSKLNPPGRAGYDTKEIGTNASDAGTTRPTAETPGSESNPPEPMFRNLDPHFSSMVPGTTKSRELLAFYLEEVSALGLPMKAARQAWCQSIIPVALAEPALLHAMLAFTSSHLTSLRKVPLADGLALVNLHKVAAIQLINEKLHEVRTATQMSVIVAIWVLATQEMTFNRDAQASRAHLLGLRDIIRLRGGIEGLPLPVIRKMLVIDLGYAAICHYPLIFSTLDFSVLPEPTSKVIDASEEYLSPSFLTQKYRSQLDPHMLRTYQNLGVVLTCQERALEASLASAPDTLSPEAIACYNLLRLPTLYHLLVFLGDYNDARGVLPSNYNVKEDSTTPMTPIQSICRVVVPIVALQDQFLPYRRSIFTAALTGRLYNTLVSEIDLEACWATYAEVMVWALMFGIYIARGQSPEKEAWFLNELVRGVRGRKGQGQRGHQLGGDWKWGWETVRPLLKRFYWCELFFGDEFREICDSLIPFMHAKSRATMAAESTDKEQYAELIACFKGHLVD